MGTRYKLVFAFGAAFSLTVGYAYSQDSPSLGDLARQQRQQRAQSKTTQAKDVKTSKVITNEQLPGHAESAAAPAPGASAGSTSASQEPAKQSTEDIKNQIQAQKSGISSLQAQIDELNESIRFAPANCVSNCVQWNEHQKEKQQMVERMQAQLEQQKKRLQEMQDLARKQNYGSSVYDP
jgi:predicted RNase H-like nuclease (RuvC/YqgF family)